MKRIGALSFAVWLVLAPPTSAGDCDSAAAVVAPLDGPLQPIERVADYRVVLQNCHRPGATDMIAIRALRVDAEPLLLAVDPEKLTTRLEREACWTCGPVDSGEGGYSGRYSGRFLAAVADFSTRPGIAIGARAQANAGLTRGHGEGVFLTGDLCPSHRPLDRPFLRGLETKGGGPATPMALSISGLWLLRHPEDFLWLRREKAEGRLAIAFVNHSFHHPYAPERPDGDNFLLLAGVDRREEVLAVERLLIANGETPSVFFRFPGLISDPAYLEEVRALHLIPLGAEAWLALTPAKVPDAGAVILVHPNGNEPSGLQVFERLRRRLPSPFLPINAAP